ncbi:MAG: MarR family winged helix-turn-helix transcriptional regulator [Aristaeellaceae bacterium]
MKDTLNNRYETFTVLVNRISRNIRRIKNQEMASYGLRSAHISCLYYLYLFGGLTATDLCERCEEDKATISRALEFLEQEGYVTDEPHATRRYKTILLLTDKGREIGAQIAGKIERVLQAIGGELTEDERVQFYRYLSIISDSLEAVARRDGGI